MARKPIFGYCSGWKTNGVAAGSTYLATGAQVNIPIVGAAPYNPKNRIRPPLMDASAFLAYIIQAKKSPGFTFAAIMKSAWHTKLLINSAVLSWDANNNSDEFAWRFSDGTSTRDFVGCRCASVAIIGSGDGRGGQLVRMDWLARQGESDATGAPAFSAFVTDGGQATGIDEVDWTGTATGVRAHSINLMRVQIPDYQEDKTLFASRIESLGFYGSVTLQMDPDGTPPANIGGTATVKFGTTPNGVQYAMNIDNDHETYPLDPSQLGTVTRQYELVNAGLIPIAVTSF